MAIIEPLRVACIGLGWWWADSAAAIFVGVSIVLDGWRNLREAVGNLADRVRLGYVVDFIRVHYDEPFDLFAWHFDRFEYPTFNVADITITIGVVLLVLDGFIEERRLKKEKLEKQAAEKSEPAEKQPDRRPTKKKKKREPAEPESGGEAP